MRAFFLVCILCSMSVASVAQRMSDKLPPSSAADVDPVAYKRQVLEFNDFVYGSAGETDSTLTASLAKSFIVLHPDYYVSLVKFEKMVSSQVVDHAERRFENFTPQLRNSVLGRKVIGIIKTSQQVLPGQMAPEMVVPTIDNKTFKLSDLKGKYVLVDFWASWCGPCRKGSPALVKAYERFKGKDFEIVSFSVDKNKEAWQSAVKEDGYTWIQVGDLKEFQSQVVKDYMVVYVPKTFLLGPDGKILATDLKGDALERQLEKIFP